RPGCLVSSRFRHESPSIGFDPAPAMGPSERVPLLRIRPLAAMTAFLSLAASACTTSTGLLEEIVTAAAPQPAHDERDRECMARAMYFESHRSSREGLIAVGSVVMNRVESEDFPDTVCEVVAQKNQFAQGIMTRR